MIAEVEVHKPSILVVLLERCGARMVVPGDVTNDVEAFLSQYPELRGDRGSMERVSTRERFYRGWWMSLVSCSQARVS
jgi:hypothetical protein